MSQTSKIAGALIIAWIVFITTRGELPAYMSLLGIGSGGASTPSGCAAAKGTPTPSDPNKPPPVTPGGPNPPGDNTAPV